MSMRDHREQILDELRDLPPEHLENLLEIIRNYKDDVQAGQRGRSDPSILELAGLWSDMSDEELDQILQLYKRRETYWTMRDIDV